MRLCGVEGCDRKHSAKGMCGKHYREQYRRDHPNAFKEWREKNLERDRANSRQWRRDNAQRASANVTRWRAANPEKARALDHARYERDREKRIALVLQRQHIKRAGGSGDPFTTQEIAERDNWRCHICGSKVTMADWSLDHLTPISRGGPHVRENVSLAHRRCNSRRGVDRIPAQLRLVG